MQLRALERQHRDAFTTARHCRVSLPIPRQREIQMLRSTDRLANIADFKAAQADPNFHWCIAPDCSWGQVHADPFYPLIACHACGFRYCYKHGVPWHDGYSCYQYDDSHPEALVLRDNEQRIKEKAKKCPGEGCGWYVEKDGGCNNMYCTRCHRSWSWADVAYGAEGDDVA